MERFIRRQNVEHYRALLGRETSPVKRAMLERLLREEENKQVDAHDFDRTDYVFPPGHREVTRGSTKGTPSGELFAPPRTR